MHCDGATVLGPQVYMKHPTLTNVFLVSLDSLSIGNKHFWGCLTAKRSSALLRFQMKDSGKLWAFLRLRLNAHPARISEIWHDSGYIFHAGPVMIAAQGIFQPRHRSPTTL